MVKTTIINLKDENNQDVAVVFGDLLELHRVCEELMLNSSSVHDMANALFQIKAHIGFSIESAIVAAEEKEKNKNK